MKFKTIVLGGGISGIICGYYLKDDFCIISDNLGGQLNSNFPLGPRYLHYKEPTETLLNSLKIDFKREIVNIGYMVQSKVLDQVENNIKLLYFLKSRNVKKLDPKISEEIKKSCMSEGKNYFEYIDFDMVKLQHLLLSNIESKSVQQDKILKIDYVNRCLFSEDKYYEYENLICTIPKNVLYYLCGLTDKVESVFSPVTYVYTADDEKYVNSDMSSYNYVYFPEKDSRFHRITKVEKGLVFDFVGEINKAEAKFYIRDFASDKDMQITTNKSAQIIKTSVLADADAIFDPFLKDVGITLVGRYAKLSHEDKIEDVIQYARNLG